MRTGDSQDYELVKEKLYDESGDYRGFIWVLTKEGKTSFLAKLKRSKARNAMRLSSSLPPYVYKPPPRTSPLQSRSFVPYRITMEYTPSNYGRTPGRAPSGSWPTCTTMTLIKRSYSFRSKATRRRAPESTKSISTKQSAWQALPDLFASRNNDLNS